eukprot:3187482-Rhodomonas_salina.1
MMSHGKLEPAELCGEREVGGGWLTSKAIYRSLLLLNVPLGHVETGLGDRVLLLLLLLMGNIDRGEQRAHKVRNAKGAASAAVWAGCMAGEVCGQWRGGHL